MGTWHYRMFREEHKHDLGEAGVEIEVVYSIRSVHYDDDGSMRGVASKPSAPTGETPQELREDLQLMLDDMDARPMLDAKEVPGW